jgi:hypothetical protein
LIAGADPLTVPGPVVLALPAALQALKSTVRADLAEFRREVGWRLPSALEPVRVSDIRQHLGPFLETTFRTWAQRENGEVQQALGEIAARELSTSSPAAGGSEPSNSPDSRLLHPSFEVSTFALDASVVAALALGIGTVFANAAVGGLFLLAAPALATLGRDRAERALRQRAAESAMKSVEDAVAKLGLELERVIDDFARRIAPAPR